MLEGQFTGIEGAALPGNRAQALAQQALEVELAFERALFANPRLSAFRRNATTWEVLLMLAGAPEGDGPGLYELIEGVKTRALGPSALLSFLRDRRDEGSLIFSRNSQKRSKWSLSLRDDLRCELLELMRLRGQGGKCQQGNAVTTTRSETQDPQQ